MRVFLDTNILLDVLLNRLGLADESEAAIAEVDRILTWARVSTAGDPEARRARALGLPDFEDALQAASAEACAAEWIVTRDAAGFKGSPIPAINPAEFLVRFPLP